ncbi:MAG: hypothetical protein AB7P02_25935 [Alphaproteobacteria bacterium]
MIFGADDRVLVSPTTTYPSTTIVQLDVTFPDGITYSSTGVMIGPNDVLTVGHAVYGGDSGGYAVSIVATPALDGTIEPFGSAVGVAIQVDPRWVANDRPDAEIDPFDYDYALITLDRDLGAIAGTMSVGVLESPIGTLLQSQGYPADLGFTHLYRVSGTVDGADENTLFFDDDLDLLPGQSGSPVYLSGPAGATVYGLISFDYEEPPFSNGVLRITPEYRDNILLWAATNDETDGNDFIIGGPWGEAWAGGNGADTIIAGDGNDNVHGGAGDDDLNGNLGRDTVDGDAGADFVRGGQGDDSVIGGSGDDWHVNGNRGNDTVRGGTGNDAVYGGPDQDSVFGGNGNDTLSGDLGDDLLTGEAGADLFRFGPVGGHDRVADFSGSAGDRIAVSFNVNGTGVATAADLVARLSVVAGGVRLDLGDGNDVVFVGASIGQITADHFLVV